MSCYFHSLVYNGAVWKQHKLPAVEDFLWYICAIKLQSLSVKECLIIYKNILDEILSEKGHRNIHVAWSKYL